MAGRLYGVSDTGIWNILLNECAGLLLRYVLACLIRASHTADDLMDAIEMAKQEAQSILEKAVSLRKYF